MRNRVLTTSWLIAGFLVGLAFVALAFGVQVRRHDPGLWTVRFARGLDCGLDYNGPPFSEAGRSLWLTCGAEDAGWQLWPPGAAREGH